MKQFETPELEVVRVDFEDVITTSYVPPEDGTPDDEL